jgi:hypothetical protein
MFSSLSIWILLLIRFHQTLSVKIGQIKHLSINSTSPVYQSSNINCTDCLCHCYNSSCSGINCFPSNHSCQLIEQQPWILESDTMINLTSDQFFAMKQNHTRLCSCYTPQNILDVYGQTNLTDYPLTTNMTSIKYIPNDETLIVLNTTIIRKLSANNLSLILRSLSTSNNAVSILYNQSNIYIAFAGNRSINMFDLNLNLLRTSISWSKQAGTFGGMFLWNNRILIIDILYSIIWSIDSLNQKSLTNFFNFTSYNIPTAIYLFIYQNESLYISSRSNNLYIFDLSNFALKQIITLSVNVSILSMLYDANCNRLWFGTQNYIYAPVLNLPSNQMNIYQTIGMISRYGVYSIDFDVNYNAFYADTNGNLRQIYLPEINC